MRIGKGGRGKGSERGRGRKGEGKVEDSLTELLLPVTCTSRVCLPASRSGSYLHSADEAATVLSSAILLSRFRRIRIRWSSLKDIVVRKSWPTLDRRVYLKL